MLSRFLSAFVCPFYFYFLFCIFCTPFVIYSSTVPACYFFFFLRIMYQFSHSFFVSLFFVLFSSFSLSHFSSFFLSLFFMFIRFCHCIVLTPFLLACLIFFCLFALQKKYIYIFFSHFFSFPTSSGKPPSFPRRSSKKWATQSRPTR